MVDSLNELEQPPKLNIKNPHMASAIADLFSKKDYAGVSSILSVLFSTEKEPLYRYHRWKERIWQESIERPGKMTITELFTDDDLIKIQKLNLLTEEQKLNTVLCYVGESCKSLAKSEAGNVIMLGSLCVQSVDAALALHYYAMSCIQQRKWPYCANKSGIQRVTKNEADGNAATVPIVEHRREPKVAKAAVTAIARDSSRRTNETQVEQAESTPVSLEVIPSNVSSSNRNVQPRRDNSTCENVKPPVATVSPIPTTPTSDEVTIKFRFDALEAFKWSVGNRCSNVYKLQKNFQVKIQIYNNDYAFVVRGPKLQVHHCVVQMWKDVSNRFRRILCMETLETSLEPCLEKNVQCIVEHEVYLVRFTGGLKLYSFKKDYVDNVMNILREMEGRLYPRKLPAEVVRSDSQTKNTLEIASAAVQGEHSYARTMRISNHRVKGWIHGTNDVHLKYLEKRYHVSISSSHGSTTFRLCGERLNVLRCVYEIWTMFTLPHHVGSRFDNIFETPLDERLKGLVRDWKNVDVAEFILQYATFVDFEREVIVSLEARDMQQALRAIEDGRFKVSSAKESFPLEFTVTFDVGSERLISLIYGTKRRRLNKIVNVHTVSIKISTTNSVTITGEQQNVLNCVIYIWTLLKSQLKRSMLPIVRHRKWSQSEIVRFIANYSVFIDYNESALYAVDHDKIEDAVFEIKELL